MLLRRRDALSHALLNDRTTHFPSLVMILILVKRNPLKLKVCVF